jgi:hypothetical protein
MTSSHSAGYYWSDCLCSPLLASVQEIMRDNVPVPSAPSISSFPFPFPRIVVRRLLHIPSGSGSSLRHTSALFTAILHRNGVHSTAHQLIDCLLVLTSRPPIMLRLYRPLELRSDLHRREQRPLVQICTRTAFQRLLIPSSGRHRPPRRRTHILKRRISFGRSPGTHRTP